jgi:hypothetical protein
MKKIVLVGLLVAVIHLSSSAQNNANAKSIFFELGGPGLASVNYDMRFNNSGQGLGFRAGVGGFPSYGMNLLLVPIGINYLASKDNKNFFEFGAGFTAASASESGTGIFSGSFGHLCLGYRLQPKEGGFTFRANLDPIIVNEGFFPFYAGIGFGWKF